MEEFPVVCTGLVPDKNKVRILTVSDHPMLHTGFANVHRHILEAISKTENVQIAAVGWYPPRDKSSESKAGKNDGLFADNTTPWYIVNCESPDLDWCGRATVPRAMKALRPEIVISIGDPWMVDTISEMRKLFNFTWIAYTPIDGLGIIEPYRLVLKEADVIVAYSTFGKQVLEKAFPRKQISLINHGTDPDVFFPVDIPKEELRKNIGMSTKENEFIVGWIARNTQRKRADLAVAAFSIFLAPSITTENNRIYFKGIDREYDTTSDDNVNIRCDGKKDASMYMHYPKNEPNGFDVMGIAEEFGVEDKLIFTNDTSVGLGVSNEKLNNIYGILDVSLNTAESEGWGMPLHESMAAGIPVVAPNFGGYLGDLISHLETGFLSNIANLNREVTSNCVRCIVDTRSTAMYLDLIYYYRLGDEGMQTFFAKWCISSGDTIYEEYKKDEKFVDTIIEKAKERAVLLSWENIGHQWRNIIAKNSATMQRERALNIVKAKSEKPHVVAVADVIDPSDLKSHGPERSFYEVIKMATKSFHVLGLGYSRNRKANSSYRIHEDGKFTAMDIVFGMGGSGDFIEAIKPKAVFTHGFPCHEVSSFSKKSKVPIIMFVYNYDYLCGNALRMGTCPTNCWSCGDFINDRHQISFNTYVKAMNNATKIVLPSNYARNTMSKSWGKEVIDFDKKTVVCYPYVDFTDPSVFFNYFDRSKNKKIVIFGGSEQKGSLTALVCAKMLPEFDFLFVESEDVITKEVADRFGNVYFSPKTATPASIYAQASLVLIPSIVPENFSRIAIEALGNNIPVLASNQGGLAEILDDRFLVKEYLSASSWVSEIETIIPMANSGKIENAIKNSLALYRQKIAKSQSDLFELIKKICS